MPGSVIKAPSSCVLTPLPTTVPEGGIHLHVAKKGHDLSTVLLRVLERDLTLSLQPPAAVVVMDMVMVMEVEMLMLVLVLRRW